MRKLILSFLFALLLLGTAAAGAESVTVMMYVCGTNLQDCAIEDISEMCAADLPDGFNVVVLAGGARQWDDRRLTAGRLNYFTIRNGSYRDVEDWGDASMGDPATLHRFVTQTLSAYPAQRTILVLWDHGSGTGRGVCFDEVHREDGLTMVELDSAFASIRAQLPSFHLDVFGMDACMMAGFEAAAVAAPYADCFVASEELEPGCGWSYMNWLNALAANTAMPATEIGRNIVNTYAEAVHRKGREEYTTLSAVDLRAFSALSADMEAMAVTLGQALDAGQLSTINRMLRRMYSYASYKHSNGGYDMYDLGDLLTVCEQFAPAAAARARQDLESCVVVSYASPDVPVASGLSIYIPQSTVYEYTRWIEPGYAVPGRFTNYARFTAGITALMNGSSYSFAASAGPESADASVVGSSAFSAGGANYGAIPAASSVGGNGGSSPSGTGLQLLDLQSLLSGSVATMPPPAATAVTAAAVTPAPDLATFIYSFLATPTPPPQSPSVVASDTQDGDPAAELAFSMSLTADAVDHLNYVQGALFRDLSDGTNMYLMELGYMRNSFVDWETGDIFCSFDGCWPTIGGQVVVLYDQSQTAVSRRSLIPARINGRDSNLVVVFEQGSLNGRVIGHSASTDVNGLPERRTTPLKPGDIVVPLFTVLSRPMSGSVKSGELVRSVREGKPFLWRSDLEVVYAPLADPDHPADYQFAFYLNDIFGGSEMSSLYPFTL